jgi:hypothetical protein
MKAPANLPHYLIAVVLLWGVVILNNRLASIETSISGLGRGVSEVSTSLDRFGTISVDLGNKPISVDLKNQPISVEPSQTYPFNVKIESRP